MTRSRPYRSKRRLSRPWIRSVGALVLSFSIAGLVVAPPTQAKSLVARVEGSIEGGGDSIPLRHLAVVSFAEKTLVVLISNEPVLPPCEVFDAMAMAEQGKLTGLQFPVNGETLDLVTEGGFNTFFYPGISLIDGYSAIKEGLNLERIDGSFAKGTLDTSVKIGERTFAISLKLTLPLVIPDPPISPRVVVGADSKPGRVFVKLVDAIVAGNLDKMKALAVTEMAEQIEQIDPAEAAEMIPMFVDFLLPKEITITETEIEGDRAVLGAEGRSEACLGTEESSGQIELLREKKKWKVASVRFDG